MGKVLTIIGRVIVFLVAGCFKLALFLLEALYVELRRSEKRAKEREKKTARAQNSELRRLRLEAARRAAND
ncbi:hypothetical protein ELH50_01260 [Rhizobium ruizarguesonis]|uniref:hypothetical protein n=1 Tax=Rhizobium TaxID=379 RepID=UPI00103278BB|nr:MULTISPECIES: hypothetical protein [Rhizobium]TAU81965.1 hypothetical protein ELI40_00985 [Rhizobium leguminosarum]TBB09825.1 hypothetical protein ELH50_01260 [Rhizobium ruizarguesonis]